ncbi:hypothetical protein BH20ACI2_BH20ACI2_25260 [soil metagenome]
MNNIELTPTQLHWREESNPFEDCCLHGGVYLRIGDVVVSDGNDPDWTVSTAAFNLLKTINQDHTVGEQRPLIPHCGHTMWILETEPDGLYLGGCDIGIDWNIKHKPSVVDHELSENRVVETSSETWRRSVCEFSDEVYAFFITAWPKVIGDQDDLKGFELFMNLWRKYRANTEEI